MNLKRWEVDKEGYNVIDKYGNLIPEVILDWRINECNFNRWYGQMVR